MTIHDTASTQSSKSLSDYLAEARRRLVETGTRNRLVHVNRSAKRANALNIINERSDDIYELLRVKGRKMKFLATGSDDAEADEGPDLSVEGDAAFDEGRYQDAFLETSLGSDALQKRLLRLFADAKTAEEEQGINILYLAMGFLKWFEDKSSAVPREAPLILIPVELKRNERGSSFDICVRDDDIVTNLPLQERLQSDFGITLPEIDDSTEWAPGAYFDRVEDAIEGREGWGIDRDGMQVGFFSFAKLLMLRDLDPENWPEAALLESTLLRGVLKEGFETEAPLFPDGESLDSRLKPSDIIQVVDADASQTKVIEEVRAGRNLVVQGPPGTGKSQTITNIIASAIHDGKSVLFVAEKMAALDVVHSRLVKTNLSDACLELHSRFANKKAFLHELGRTLNAGLGSFPSSADTSSLEEIRNRLNRIASTLHDRVPGRSYTPISAMAQISRLFGKKVPAPSIAVENADTLDDDAVNELAELISAYAAALEKIGSPAEHPFYSVENLNLQPTDQQRLEVKIRAAHDGLQRLQDTANNLSEALSVSAPQTLKEARNLGQLLGSAENAPVGHDDLVTAVLPHADDTRLTEALVAGADWKNAQEVLSETFSEAAFTAPVEHMRHGLAAGLGSFFSRLFGPYRRTSNEFATLLKGPLPKTARERVALLDSLVAVQKKRKVLAEDEGYLQEKLGGLFRGERTRFAELVTVAAWLKALKSLDGEIRLETCRKLLDMREDAAKAKIKLEDEIREVESKLTEIIKELQWQRFLTIAFDDVRFEDFSASLSKVAQSMPLYSQWVDTAHKVARLNENGMSAFVSALDEGKLSAASAVDEFRYGIAEARWNNALKTVSDLSELARLNRHQLVDVFQTLEKRRFVETADQIKSKHLSQMPKGAAGPMGFLRAEIAKKTRHRSIRKIMEAAGDMVQRIKPVFLMSPISVAQYLKPGTLNFDLLVIDEASQVRPEDALGAIARCGQIVVVGDRKQLPPTSFFDKLAGNAPEEEDEDAIPETSGAVELESILTACEARGLRSAMLEWHYRSRDPSLIQVSNAEFYESRLVLPPSPVQLDENFGLRFNRVEGVYSSKSKGNGRAGTNIIEAERIAEVITRHAQQTPNLSLGVVAFSKSQADMITEVLEVQRRTNSTLDDFLREGRAEDVFVKNIENVQGDERDVILISVGYGPHEPNGRLASMNFGPVNGEGGERRLNVLFSRARVLCDVFCSFDPGDIDPRKATRDGPRILKRFLEFAKSGQIEEASSTGFGPDSPFEEDVAEVIRGLGYPVDYQVGSSGFRIDLGVRHPDKPGQYILAVECDGATYHGALWARERDRLRQAVLEGLGWKFHRIWSTDWFHRRTDEIQRLQEMLAKAIEASDAVLKIAGANEGGMQKAEEPEQLVSDFTGLDETELTAAKYRRAKIIVVDAEPHLVQPWRMAGYVTSIVEQEGPIHSDEVARRIAYAFGKNRAGGRIHDAVVSALKIAANKKSICHESSFWFTESQRDEPPIRSRSEESSPTTKAEYLSHLEIEAAAKLIRTECGELEEDEMVRAVCRLLGYLRAGPDLQSRIRTVLF